MGKIRIAVIDDHEVVINGIRSMLAGLEDISIEFSTTSAQVLLDYLCGNEVDVLLLDIQMPGINGVELCKQVAKKHPQLKMIAFTSFDDSHYVRQMVRSGVAGYLLKNTDQQTMIRAIHTVMQGEEFLDEPVKKILLQESLTGQRRSIYEIPLTRREKEILKLVAEGLSSQQISGQLYISLRTVETHRLNLSQKLGTKNTAALVKEAIRRGLIE